MQPQTRITTLRIQLGWSIERLAYESRVPAAEIRAIERGQYRDGRSISRLHNAFQAAKKVSEGPTIAIPGLVIEKPLSAYRFSKDPAKMIEQLKALDPAERESLYRRLLVSIRSQRKATTSQG